MANYYRECSAPKKALLAALFIGFFAACTEYSYKNLSNSTPVFVVHIQDFFKEDTISFSINECTILTESIVNSASTGNASIGVKAYRKNAKKMMLVITNRNKRKKQLCSAIEDMLTLHVILNGHLTIEQIDLKKGTYLGINKSLKNKVKIRQSARKFIYE